MSNDLGSRLRAARKAEGLSLRSLAVELGISPSLISQVETNKTQPSVATLYALVNRLNVSMDELLGSTPFRATPAAAPVAVENHTTSSDAVAGIQRAANNPVLEMENGVRWERLSSSPNQPVEPLLVTYSPGASGALEGKLTRHSGVEYAYVIEGTLHVQVDFDTHILYQGDSIQFDSTRPHVYSNRGTAPARGLWFVLGRREAADGMPDAAGQTAPATQLHSTADALRMFGSL